MNPIDLENEQNILRVAAKTPSKKLAASIAHALYEHRRVVVRAIGAGATNQAIKACAIARGYVAPRGLDLVVIPSFETVPGSGDADELSSNVLIVKAV
jgi:stage V sporulation protein S